MQGTSRTTALLIGLMSGLFFWQMPVQASGSVQFAWSPNAEPDVAGYKVYYGVASRSYTEVIDAGNATTVTVSNLVAGTTYYFALVAYNALGLQSDYTGELTYSVPLADPDPPARLVMRIVPPKQTVLTVIGSPGRTYDIEASTDLTAWETIGVVTLDSTGMAIVTEDNPSSRSRRFYRARAV